MNELKEAVREALEEKEKQDRKEWKWIGLLVAAITFFEVIVR